MQLQAVPAIAAGHLPPPMKETTCPKCGVEASGSISGGGTRSAICWECLRAEEASNRQEHERVQRELLELNVQDSAA
jgi:hypothetical protein